MALTRIQTPDRNLQLIQDNIASAILPLQNSLLTLGNILTDIALLAGQDNSIAHGLGYTPTLFILTQQDADSRVWQSAADSDFITMQCSNDCTVSLWVK